MLEQIDKAKFHQGRLVMNFKRDFILIVFALLFTSLVAAFLNITIFMTYYNTPYFWIILVLIVISLIFLYKQIRSIDKEDTEKKTAHDKAMADAIRTLNSNISTLSNKLNKLDKLDKIDNLIKMLEKQRR